MSIERPLIKEKIDWSEVIANAEAYLDEVEDGIAEDSDTPHYIFEAVMTAVFGEEVFTYTNSIQE